MSILNDSVNLTNHSLESFINEVTQTNQTSQIHELVRHPKINTISDKSKKLFDVFLYSTYQEYKKDNQGVKLNDKQVYQLKRVTIFSLFEGRHEIPILYLSQQLDLSKVALYKLLIQMNTSGTISIKINEKSGICQIFSAPSRLKRNYQELKPAYQIRLRSIIDKNSRYLSCLSDAKGEEKKKPHYGYN